MILKDKVVIISGIGPGLGQALSTLAAKEGAKVAIAARTSSKLDSAEREIKELGLGTDVLKVPTDVSNRQQCRALVERTVERFGRVDGLVNSAYVAGAFTLVEDADLDDWRQTMDVNLFGSLNLCQAAIPHMKANGGGAIVNVNTMVTRKPLAGQGGYATSKGALAVATAQLATELGQHNIRVNSTFMGWMWGPSVEGYMRSVADAGGPPIDEQKAEVSKNIALGRIPEDRECARPIIMLLSDYASVVTGASLEINGGEFMPM